MPATDAVADDLPNLDVLRSLAVLLVVLDHAIELVAVKTGRQVAAEVFALGRLGVVLFFVHTSFVLMRSLERLHVHRRHLLLRFYVRRAFRIYPLSVATVLFVLLARVPDMPWNAYREPGLRDVVSNLALTMNLSHSAPVLLPLWSLPLEVQMYVILPLAFLAVRGPRGILVASLLWVASILLGLAQSEVWHRVFLLQFGPCFMAGVLAYALSRTTSPVVPSMAWPAGLVALAAAYVGLQHGTDRLHPPALAWGASLAVALAIPLCRGIGPGWLARASNQLARYSYGVYLTHCIAIWAGFFALPRAPLALRLLVCLAVLVALPLASYRFVEEPLIKIGRRLSR
ncbi:MAG: acyltransferase [Gemmatimonadetes bacterium]|nr:acyltransferase [Gemmatimonadota bacterium]MBI3569439.1 acyltransferase [Gemmatimonadota bacterium]